MGVNKISIKNFRVFKEKTTFQLRPFTILTGPNNSGKSSLLKILNLLQQSVKELNSLNVLNFEKGNHNLATFENSISWGSENEDMSIVFDFPLDFFDEDFKLELIYDKMGEIGYIKSFKIYNQYRKLIALENIKFENDINYQSFVSGDSGYDYEFSFDLEYIKKFVYQEKVKNAVSNISNEKLEDFLFYSYSFFDEEENKEIDLNEIVKKNSKKELKEDLLLIEKTSDIFQKVEIDNYQLKRMNTDLFSECFTDDNIEPLILWKERYRVGSALSNEFKSDFFKNNDEFNFFDDNILVHIEDENLNIFRKLVINNIQNSLDKLKYSVSDIDFLSAQRGCLNNETEELVKQFSSLYLDLGDGFLKKALKLLNINGEIKVERVNGRYTTVSLIQNDKKVNILDLGYGYSQVIPILLKILVTTHLHKTKKSEIDEANVNENPTLIIEEPESNLHPNLQSKLADILVLANKTFGIRFIIETHSEYLIRKLQYLTAKKEINLNNAVVYYFNSDEFVNNNEPKVKEIFINEFGGLSDTFGPGFFDEATDLKFQLMKLNQSQRN
ncbi:MAG: putative ATPase [Flavobacteriaceae bacterium]|jgi:predicted ATPase